MSTGSINLKQLVDEAKRHSASGKIDNLSHLTDSRIYLFSGSSDHTVVPKVVATAEDFYDQLGATALVHNFGVNAGHCMPTVDYGSPCSST